MSTAETATAPERAAAQENWIKAVHEKNKNAVVQVFGYGPVTADVEGQKREAEIQMGHGSGFCVSVETNKHGQTVAYFVTNRHVLQGALARGLPPRVFLPNGEERSVARFVDDQTSYFRDVAVLEVILQPGDIVDVVEQRAEPLKIGEKVVSMSSPGSHKSWTAEGTVTRLPLPGVYDSTPARWDADRYGVPQTTVDQGYGVDINIGPGSSGSPLFDSEGRLIGIGGHNEARGGLKPVYIGNRDAEAYLRYPKVMLDIQDAFDEVHEIRSAEDAPSLRKVFSKLLLVCASYLQGLPEGEREDAARIVFGDSAVRAMFMELILASPKNDVEWYNNEFNKLLGPLGVPPLLINVQIDHIEEHRSEWARAIRESRR